MKNMNLNVGGLIGAVLAIGGVVAFFMLSENEFPRRSGKLIGLAGLAGGALGNWIWSLAFPPADTSETSEVNPGVDA